MNNNLELKKRNQKIKSVIIYIFALLLISLITHVLVSGSIETSVEENLRAFTLIIWSILLEALPFVLIGTVISSLIQVFVSEETILKVLPKNEFLQLIFASCLGLIFPVCECAIIPITRGLIKKGLPVGPAFAFMIATPIVNPVVLISTYNAFNSNPEMVILRGVFGFLGAIIIGMLVSSNKKDILLAENDEHHHSHEHSNHSCDCDHCHDHKPKGFFEAVKHVIGHTSEELKSVGMYLIFGAIIAALMQMFVSKDFLLSIGSGRVVSILVMMILAFVLSLCSEADAFIARTFMLQFSSYSVLAFLITGPMIDIKNTLMLFGSFKKKFVIKLITKILLVCFGLSLLASYVLVV